MDGDEAKGSKEGPLMQSVDYPEFVVKFVKDEIAAQGLKASDEIATYVAQDVESYLLDSGKRMSDLNDVEMFHLVNFVRDTVNDMSVVDVAKIGENTGGKAE